MKITPVDSSIERSKLDLNQEVVDKVCYLVYQRVKNWDASHNYSHVYRATMTTMKICDRLKPTVNGLAPEDVVLVAVVAILVHDLIDPKYVADPDSAANQLRNDLLSCGMPPGFIEPVILVIQNISYSKEKRHGVDYQALGCWGVVRDIVSDADKIDALGLVGIERCQEYIRKLHGDTGHATEIDPKKLIRETIKHVNEKLLELLPKYLCTEPGIEIATPLHQEILDWVELHE